VIIFIRVRIAWLIYMGHSRSPKPGAVTTGVIL